MHNRQRMISLSSLILIGVLINVLSVGGQQQKPSQETKNDEPIAITEKSKPTGTITSKPIGEDQFGNFRFPIINNKGEIAFLGLFQSSTSKAGSGEAFFIRSNDGSWKLIRGDEKPINLSERIHGIILPSFNDKGDLTFVANYGEEDKKAATPLDPNDPAAHVLVVKKQALFVRNADGLKVLLKVGEEVPNMPSIFSRVGNASTNSKGTTAFIGTYSEPDGRGLFLIEDGKLRLIVRSGQKLGAGEEGTFSEHYFPSTINERNEVAFTGRLNDKFGIFVARATGLETVAMVGKPSPIKEADYLGFSNRTPTINNKGEVAFVAFYAGSDSGRGLFVKGAGPTQVVARSGENIPGTTYNFTDFYSPAINSGGDIAFIGNYGGRSRGIFIRTAKGFRTVAVLDQPVPGGAKDEVFNNFNQPSINDRGEVVFYAQTKGRTTGINVGIFMRDEKGVLRAIAMRGDQIPN